MVAPCNHTQMGIVPIAHATTTLPWLGVEGPWRWGGGALAPLGPPPTAKHKAIWSAQHHRCLDPNHSNHSGIVMALPVQHNAIPFLGILQRHQPSTLGEKWGLGLVGCAYTNFSKLRKQFFRI